MSETTYQQTRQEIRRKLGLDKRRAILGDADGVIYEDMARGLVRVRQETANGFSLDRVVRFRGQMRMKPGRVVTLGYDEDGELCVLNPNFAGQVQQGVSPFEDNAADENRVEFVNQQQIVTALSHPTSPASDSVAVQPWIFVRDGVIQQFAGEQVDLSSYWPGAEQQRVVGLFYDEASNEIQASASTAQHTLDPLTLEDVQESIDGAGLDNAPIWFWKMAGADGTLKKAQSFLDGRQFLNVPPRAVYTQTAIGSLTNKTALTSILYSGIGSQTLPAYYLKVGRQLRVNLRGHISSDVTPGTLDVRLRLNNTELCAATFGTLNGGMSNRLFEARFDLTCQQIGASGKVVAGGRVDVDSLVAGAVQTGQTTVDTTAAQVIDVLAAWSIADGENVLTTQIASVEVAR